jgi:hypothetical protein
LPESEEKENKTTENTEFHGEGLASSGGLALVTFPEFCASGLKDYLGRSVEESLEAIRRLSGLDLPLANPNENRPLLGRSFWAALIRGGYQGALYLIDCLGLAKK